MIVKATTEDIEEVCSSLRHDDRKEIMGTRWDESHESLVSSFVHIRGGKFAAIHDDRAVCIFGITPVYPGVGQGWLIGTDEIGKCGVEIAHAAKKIIKAVFDLDTHRVQAFSAAFHTQAHQWLEMIGFHRESVMKQFGKDGSDYFCYVITR